MHLRGAMPLIKVDRNSGEGATAQQDFERHAGERRREERVTLCALGLYRTAAGPLDALLASVQLPPLGAGALAAYVSGLSVPQMARVTARAVAQLVAQDNRMAGRPVLRPCDWRVILYSLSGARTLREAIGRCMECFEAIDWRCGRMDMRASGDVAELSLDAMRPAGKTAAGCLIDLFGLTQIHALLAWLIGRPIEIRHAALNHEECVFQALDLPDISFPILFAGGWSGFAFDAAMLDYPVVRTADELADRPPDSLLFGGSLLTEGGRAADTAEQVRRIALRSLSERQRLPAFAEIAATMGGSGATLRRRLVRQGTSYRQIRESCRRELALDLLSRTTLPIEVVAARLDYCDSDAFRQAFREWTGVPPSSYRQAMRPVA
ncbi:helix-turn-helix domain-containing protein [Sphingobium sp.]|uniref:helix-turn-helix domain-containing protein n=1 Tax=Sphingobium sp. TaxID=1912891 RepID=UPI0035C741B3